MVQEGAHGRILCNANARSLPCSAGTWLLLTLEGAGAEEAVDHVTVTVFSLSLKDTALDRVVRDQPSGILTTKWPAEDRKGTNWVLSGMSPGGLLSTATGFSVRDGLP